MFRSFLTVSSGTLASRLLGFVRDSVIAALLGAGPVADAFLAAFQLVNVVRRLLSEGGLNAALVPAWLKARDAGGMDAATAFAGRVLGTISAAVVAAALVIGALMPLVIAAIAPGFVGRDTLQFAVDDARLMLPYLAFAGPVTVMMALLSAQGRFALTAFSPLLFNIALISVMAVLLVRQQEPAQAALVMAATIGIAGFLQLSMLALRGARLASPLRVSFDPDMRGFLGRAIPGMVASSAPQWLMVAGAVIASTSPSAVSWLYFANRLLELPLGIVGVAMGTVLIPEMTHAVRSGESSAIAHAESRALELAVGLALPATLGLMVLSEPIVRMLFEHGAFTAQDSAATAQALIWLTLALPAHVLVKALSPAFFAREDTLTPLLATLKAIVVTIAAAFLFGHIFGRERNCRRHCARRLEQRTGTDPQGGRDLRLLDRCRCAPPAAAHPGRGARDGRPALARRGRAAVGRQPRFRAGGLPARADRLRYRRLRAVLAAFRRHRLARGG
ncbi:putative peptidoglycan lipid II flippase [Bradyrhizobium elkanii]